MDIKLTEKEIEIIQDAIKNPSKPSEKLKDAFERFRNLINENDEYEKALKKSEKRKRIINEIN